MLLSIIVPVYNGEKKITRCLESLRALKESELEFLIINDGSTDHTAEIVESYVQKDRRFRLINQSNSGVSGARNKGLDVCQGEYVGFLDADDELTSDYEEVLKAVKNLTYELFAFDLFYQTSEKAVPRKRECFAEGENDRRVLYNNFFTGFSNSTCIHIYRNDIIQKNHIRFEEGMAMGEDSFFNSRYFKYCQKFYYINRTPYKYYIDDDGSAVHVRKPGYLKDFAKMYEGYLSIYELEEGLEFDFNSESYFWQVYEILKTSGRSISREDNKAFRRSKFYKAITDVKYDHWLKEVRKWLIKGNIYRIFLP